MWSLSNVHYLEKVQFTGTWESLTRRTEGSISEGVLGHKTFLAIPDSLYCISTHFVLLRFAMETYSENNN